MCVAEIIQNDLLDDSNIWVLFNLRTGFGWRSPKARKLWIEPDPWTTEHSRSLIHPIEDRRVQDVVSTALKTQRQQFVRFWCSLGPERNWMLAEHVLYPKACPACSDKCPLLLVRVHPIQFSPTPPHTHTHTSQPPSHNHTVDPTPRAQLRPSNSSRAWGQFGGLGR